MAGITRLKSGGVMLETSPTDCVILDDEELGQLADAYNESQMEIERDSNEFQTINQRDTNETPTAIESTANDSQTDDKRESIIVRLKRKAQTAAASMSHLYMPVETPAKVISKNKALATLLADKKFMESNSPYGRRGNPNYFSVPPSVVQAVNEQLGTDYKQAYVAKVWLSMKYQQRYSPIFVKFICVVWIISLVLVIYWCSGASTAPLSSPTATAVIDLRKEVREWETQNNYYFSGWRLQNEISKCGIKDRGKLAEYLKKQAKDQGPSFVQPQNWK